MPDPARSLRSRRRSRQAEWHRVAAAARKAESDLREAIAILDRGQQRAAAFFAEIERIRRVWP